MNQTGGKCNPGPRASVPPLAPPTPLPLGTNKRVKAILGESILTPWHLLQLSSVQWQQNNVDEDKTYLRALTVCAPASPSPPAQPFPLPVLAFSSIPLIACGGKSVFSPFPPTLAGIKGEKTLTKSIKPLHLIAAVRALWLYYAVTKHLCGPRQEDQPVSP